MGSRSGSRTKIDVARDAGVSVDTVARALNHEPGVHVRTGHQVLKGLEALRYSPSSRRAALRAGDPI